jgi:hypothetical protein
MRAERRSAICCGSPIGLLLAGICVLANCSSAGPKHSTSVSEIECQLETVLYDSIGRAVNVDGYVGPITIMRDDRQSLVMGSWESQVRYKFYEVVEGGYGVDSAGKRVFTASSHPRRWRLFVDCVSGELFRMHGFAGATEWDKLVRKLSLSVTAQSVPLVARSYVSLAYAGEARVLDDELDLREILEDQLHGLLELEEIDATWNRWRGEKGNANCVLGEPAPASSEGNGFAYRLQAGVSSGACSYGCQVAVHDLSLHVASDGSVGIASDEVRCRFEMGRSEGGSAVQVP